jgi:hypothetical protein
MVSSSSRSASGTPIRAAQQRRCRWRCRQLLAEENERELHPQLMVSALIGPELVGDLVEDRICRLESRAVHSSLRFAASVTTKGSQ